MRRTALVSTLGLALIPAMGAGRVIAQVSLADDIILASRGGERKGTKGEETALGSAPGSNAGPFRRVPGSSAVLLGRGIPGPEVVPGAVLRPGAASPLNSPGRGDEEPGRGLFQAPERRPIAPPAPIPRRRRPATDREEIPGPELDDPGPPDGLTLDQAIAQTICDNQELRTKFYEIPLAEADVLTAGLRDNPLFFYDSTGVPYGSAYAQQRPGSVDHALSIVYPLDVSGKRKARLEVARRAKRVLEAQYQDAVRLEIDDLYDSFVDVLAARDAVRAAERGLRELDHLLARARVRSPLGGDSSEGPDEDLEEIQIERDTAAVLLDGEHGRLVQATRDLATQLNVPPARADALRVRGLIRVPSPPPLPTEVLIDIALRCRPDLIAYRLGILRARADVRLAQADRVPEPYLLYTPWSYTDNSQMGLKSISTWGAGIFVSLPFFNRNQGNIRRAELNVAQSQSELAQRERRVIDEVRRAIEEYEDTRSDLERLDRTLMPAVLRKRERARRRFEAGQIGVGELVRVQRDYNSLIRYYRENLIRNRRRMLSLDTAVGQRIMP